MVKHTQTTRRQQVTNCFSVFDHFVGLVLKGLTHRECNSNTTENVTVIMKQDR